MTASVPSPAPGILPPLGLLAELDESVRSRLAVSGRFEELPAGHRLATQGEDHHSLAVLLSGKASVHFHARGEYLHLTDVKPGETVGEMNMIDHRKASADVSITEPALVWQIDESEFQKIVEQDLACAYQVILWLARQVCRRLRQNSEHMVRTAEEHKMHFRDMDY